MHIIGMAKSHLDLEGAKAPKLELDFVKIAYTLSRLEVLGESGKGFLLVFTEPIANRAKGWIKRYDTKESIEIFIAELTDQEMKSLRDEKVNNVEGMISGTQGYTVGDKSRADYGQQIGESHLRKKIEQRYPRIARVTDPKKYPLGIQWDYYGTI